jgi:hypothetical protein
VLLATIPANLLTTPVTVQISVSNPTGPISNSIPFAITFPAAQLTSISSSTATSGSTAIQLQVTGSNFLNGVSQIVWTFGGTPTTLATSFQDSAHLLATIPAGLLAIPGTAQLSIRNASAPVSNPLLFTITVPISLTGLAPTSVPSQPTSVGVALSSPLPSALNGTLTLSFESNAANTPPGYKDPALQFAAGGTTLDFTIPAGSTVATLPLNGTIQQGTVAGTVTVAATRIIFGDSSVLPQSPVLRTVDIPRLPPVIVSGTVKITNRTSSGFNVEFDTYSTPRDISTITFAFQPANGTTLTATSFTVSAASIAQAWFTSAAGLSGGGAFHLTIPFNYSGDTGALGSVTVTISNSQGTSAAQTGS